MKGVDTKETNQSEEIMKSLPKPNIQDCDPAILEMGKKISSCFNSIIDQTFHVIFFESGFMYLCYIPL